MFPDCVRQWNSLDNTLRNMNSYDSFKNKISTVRKSPSFFYIGIRTCNVIHAQLRMNCSSLNAHLYSLHVIDNPACLCSHSIEDTAHFFLDCPRCFTQRIFLHNSVSRLAEFKVETLLFGDSKIDYEDNFTIMLTVHEYIKDTERF